MKDPQKLFAFCCYIDSNKMQTIFVGLLDVYFKCASHSEVWMFCTDFWSNLVICEIIKIVLVLVVDLFYFLEL